LGPYASDLTRSVVPVARQHRKVLWNHGGAADDIHRLGGRVVGILTPVSGYFTGLVDMVANLDPHARRVAILYRRHSGFGKLAARGARAAANRAGLTTDILSYTSSQELRLAVDKLGRAPPDLVLSAGTFEDDCTLAREFTAKGLGAKAFGLTGAALQGFQRVLGPKADGYLGPSQWEPGIGAAVDCGPDSAGFVASMKAVGASPDYPAAQAYAACLIASRCLEVAGSADDDALWRAACELDCHTFFGRFKIDPTTGIQDGHQMVWVQWHGGRKVIVWPPAVAEAPPNYPVA
jgi:branched-chain amino acid transport system substrate-binding protein